MSYYPYPTCIFFLSVSRVLTSINSVANHSFFRRQGSIRLADNNSNADLESGETDNEDDSDDEDDCDAPFGGFPKRTRENKGLRLPEKVDEKAAWI